MTILILLIASLSVGYVYEVPVKHQQYDHRFVQWEPKVDCNLQALNLGEIDGII